MSNEVIEKTQTGLDTSTQPQRGFEGGVDQEDLIIPRAKLIQALSPELAEGVDGIKMKLLGVPDEFLEHGPQTLLRKKLGLDAEGIAGEALKLLGKDI